MNHSEHIAAQVVSQLQQEFPEVEIQNHRPEECFDGFFTEFGFPMDCAYFPIWEEPGHVIYIEDPDIYWWNNDRFDFESASNADGVPGMAILFLHEDGTFGVVDEADGALHRLLKTPEPRVLAEFVKLFFGAGRAQLASKGRPTAALQSIEVPFFQYPDDYSEKSYLMPTVPAGAVRDLVLDHVNAGTPWLCALESLDSSIRKQRENALAQKDSLEPLAFDEQREGVSGWEWYLQILEEENERRTKTRPRLLQMAAAMDETLIIRAPADPLHATNWLLPYRFINETHPGDGLKLPIRLQFNDGVFAPFLEREINPNTREHCAALAGRHIRLAETAPLPWPLEIPSYAEQVELTLIHWATTLQAPLIAEKQMDLPTLKTHDAKARADVRRAFIAHMRNFDTNQ